MRFNVCALNILLFPRIFLYLQYTWVIFPFWFPFDHSFKPSGFRSSRKKFKNRSMPTIYNFFLWVNRRTHKTDKTTWDSILILWKLLKIFFFHSCAWNRKEIWHWIKFIKRNKKNVFFPYIFGYLFFVVFYGFCCLTRAF